MYRETADSCQRLVFCLVLIWILHLLIVLTPMDVSLVLLLLLCCALLLLQSEGSGVFQVQIISLSNELSLTGHGKCCDGTDNPNACQRQCKTFIKVCLMHQQTDIRRPYIICTLGEKTTSILGGSNLMLTKESGDGPYIVAIPFSFSWPKSFTLILEVWTDLVGDQSLRDFSNLIMDAIISDAVTPSAAWRRRQNGTLRAELTYAYRVTCDAHYYNESCNNYCRPRDDQFGHYTCDENGLKACNDGWTGHFCDKAICQQDCNLKRGYCDVPGECICRIGWTGPSCEICLPLPGCEQGFCKRPWDCLCHSGWRGYRCSIDLAYCELNQPCQNSGTCLTDLQANYTCHCPNGYHGNNCEIPTCRDHPCLNNARCQVNDINITCHCTPGYYGERCEHTLPPDPCAANPCLRGGLCIRNNTHEHEFHCACQLGLRGKICDVKILDFCQTLPCKNGGRCVHSNSSIECDCQNGYSGRFCEISRISIPSDRFEDLPHSGAKSQALSSRGTVFCIGNSKNNFSNLMCIILAATVFYQYFYEAPHL